MLGRQLEEWAGRSQDAGWRESWWPQWRGGGRVQEPAGAGRGTWHVSEVWKARKGG